MSLELEASARAAQAKMVERRLAMTAGLAPEEVRAIDAARDAQPERERSREVAPRRAGGPAGAASSSRAGTVAAAGTGLASASELVIYCAGRDLNLRLGATFKRVAPGLSEASWYCT